MQIVIENNKENDDDGLSVTRCKTVATMWLQVGKYSLNPSQKSL